MLWYPTSREKRARYPDFLYSCLVMAACAAFIEESRMEYINATKPHRKSGVWGTRHWLLREGGGLSADYPLQVGWIGGFCL